MRKPAIGPPTRLATTSPSVATAMPTSSALASPKRSAMIGAQAIVVPCPPMSEAEPRKRRDPLRQAERRDAAGGDQVLDDEIGERQAEQDEERPAARNEVVELGVEADAGEEIEQEHVARLEREADLDSEPDIGDERQHGREQAAGHRLRNVPAPERRDEAIEAGAGEEHDDGDRERQQPGRLDRRHRLSRSMSLRAPPPPCFAWSPPPLRARRRASLRILPRMGEGDRRSAVERSELRAFPPPLDLDDASGFHISAVEANRLRPRRCER